MVERRKDDRVEIEGEGCQYVAFCVWSSRPQLSGCRTTAMPPTKETDIGDFEAH